VIWFITTTPGRSIPLWLSRSALPTKRSSPRSERLATALAESVNADYKNELVDYGPRYPGMAELSLATAEWVAWYNRERPNTYCCDLTPDRAEELHYAQIQPRQPEGAVT